MKAVTAQKIVSLYEAMLDVTSQDSCEFSLQLMDVFYVHLQNLTYTTTPEEAIKRLYYKAGKGPVF